MSEAAPIGSEVPDHLPQSLVDALGMSKQQLLAASGEASALIQTGGGYAGELSLSAVAETAGRDGAQLHETVIETFVVDHDGACRPTGTATAIIEAFRAPVQSMVQQVAAALEAGGVWAKSPAYVTASLTPGGDVIGDAHLDDDQYVPHDGVGVVAIVCSHVGTRIATGHLAIGPARPGLPLDLAPEIYDRFGESQAPYQLADGGKIVIFPQFGQLHAGPGPSPVISSDVRALLVYRAETVPAPPDPTAGSET